MRWEDGKLVINDSRGNPSVTLPMVYAAFVAVIFRFVVSDHWGYPNMDGVELAAALAAVGGIWAWRENKARKQERFDRKMEIANERRNTEDADS